MLRNNIGRLYVLVLLSDHNYDRIALRRCGEIGEERARQKELEEHIKTLRENPQRKEVSEMSGYRSIGPEGNIHY
ncbi:hypothetical protein ANCCAN_18835 [Ancylostoma caninum]|uniref:Uncharacterized protein n=1 Tax=Ancylostoma caninum TaxID=29170 RepID=A0A368FT09_ANCCA|nr:hypothetical protein ANCCAN_18835 [Ancylostoma caninum]